MRENLGKKTTHFFCFNKVCLVKKRKVEEKDIVYL